MAVKLYNSLSGKKEPLIPIQDKHIKLYVCGMTVYDDCHIGHARTQVAFDVIVRYLRFLGFGVTWVRNITDVEDKIIKRAAKNNESVGDLVARNIQSMYEDFDRLNILRPDFEPRATETIAEMCQMIETLIAQGNAYRTKDGDVYYRVASFPDYGKLSKQDIQALQAGIRVEVSDLKESPLDFVLWKAAKPAEPSWDAPWGKGRPGWHIECSAMAKKIFGDHFDIHGGGSDLRFPHHENEIAQSESANGCSFANYWLHSGMVQVNDEKMSKSLNNFFTIKTVLSEYHPEVVRFFLISGQYRSEIHYSQENLDQAKASVDRLYNAIRGLKLSDQKPEHAATYIEPFKTAMNNDFNTPEAISVLFELAKEVNKYRKNNLTEAEKYASLLSHLGQILGILWHSPETYFTAQDDKHHDGMTNSEIEKQIAIRSEAKREKNWALADEIRRRLSDKGILLEDSASGTTWKRG